MTTIALDTNTVNRIADTTGFVEEICKAVAAGMLIIIRIPMIRAEIQNTADTTRREVLLKVWASLPGRDVLTQGGYYDVGLTYGESYYGDGSDTGLPLCESRTKGRGGAGDAIIATTAAGEADVLVTDDLELAHKVHSSGVACEVWSFQQFRKFVQGKSL